MRACFLVLLLTPTISPQVALRVEPQTRSVADTPISEIETAMNTLTVAQVFEDKAFDNGGHLTGTWKYMLTGGSKAYDEYTFNDFDQLMINISENIKEASMQELVDDKVMTFEGIELDQTTIMGVPISTLTSGAATQLGDLSLIDLLNLIKE